MKDRTLYQFLPFLDRLSEEKKAEFEDYFQSAPASLLESIRILQVKKGEIILREGEPADRIYIVGTGIVEGVDYRILTTPYDFLRFDQVCALGGMEYLMDLDRYMTTIRAITPCEIITFPRSMLHSWFSVSAEALKREAKLMGSYLMEDCRKGRLFLFLDGADRLALLFVEQFKRYSTDGLFLVRRSRQELADETGLCLKSISRAAKKLTAEGLVTKTGNQLSINREQFERMEALLSEKIDLT